MIIRGKIGDKYFTAAELHENELCALTTKIKNMLEELTKEITNEESNESKAKTGYEESKAQLDSDINALTTNTSKSE